MFSKKVLIGILVLILLLVGVGVGVFLVRQRQELRKEAAPATSLSLTPSQSTARVGETVSLTVAIDTAQNQATAADLRITYDSKKLTLTDFRPGTFLPVTLSAPRIDNNQGLATAVFGAQPANVPKGKGSLGTLVFQAKEGGTVSVAFSPQTEVTGVDEETNVLVAKNPATVTVQGVATGVSAPGTSQAQAAASPPPIASPRVGVQGVGGTSASPSPSPKTTASPKAAAAASSTVKATASPKPTATAAELPQAGFSLPTAGLLGAGVLILLLGVILAF